jgi:GAF domain-containing protein
MGLRQSCRWIRASIPENEPARLTSLGALDLLDTEPEERFDRITRVATALFNVPMATITLIDERRQWFKSCQGTAGREDPRDASLCAHVVSQREPMIVVDTLSDDRFADNPLAFLARLLYPRCQDHDIPPSASGQRSNEQRARSLV